MAKRQPKPKPKVHPKPWPRLSVDHPATDVLHRCQKCGDTASVELSRWMEHDESDRPEPIVVVLCPDCAGEIIEDHPRLYRELPKWEPHPGAMGICVKCVHRQGTVCKSPQAGINGGPGLDYVHPPTRSLHVLYSQKVNGCRGRWITEWTGPVTECSGRVAKDPLQFYVHPEKKNDGEEEKQPTDH